MGEGFRGVAVIGTGAWGVNHVRVWSELDALRVVCDVDPRQTDQLVEKYPGLQATNRVEDAFGHDDVSAVVIATPAVTHAELALQAMRAGKDVLIEKPIALHLTDAEAILETARSTDRIVGVGHVLEYHPAVAEIGRLIETGELGRLRYLYSNRLNIGKIRTEENSLWSFAPHDLAIMLRLVGSLPLEVDCHGGAYLTTDIADVTVTTLRFGRDIRGHIFVSWLHPFKEQRFVAIGDSQMAVFSDTVDWDSKLMLYPHGVDWKGGQVPVARRAEGRPVALVPAEPLRAQAEHMIECWSARRQPLTDAKSALQVLQVLHLAQAALDKGGLPLQDRATRATL